MALDPFIPLFRFYRDSLLRSIGLEALMLRAPSAVLDDYYFDRAKIAIMKALQHADPDIPFDMAGWDDLKSAIANRMKLASVDLIPHLDELPAPTFRETFVNTTRVIAAARGEADWVGFNDNWTMEFFPLIARLIPDAKFMLHLRDPRAVVNSSEFAEPDPAKRPTVLSFARHLRKHFAFAMMFASHPELRKRLLITRYEPFLEDLETEVRRMTDFLDITFEPSMIDVTRFRKADGDPWPTNWEIYRSSGDAWRREMPPPMVEVIEFVCEPEMRLHGYVAEVHDPKRGLSDDGIQFAARNARECLGWRTDFPETERTIGSELYRKRMLTLGSHPPEDEAERCFLFTEVYDRLRTLYSGARTSSDAESDYVRTVARR